MRLRTRARGRSPRSARHATGIPRGVVHLNFPFRKPLEPVAIELPDDANTPHAQIAHPSKDPPWTQRYLPAPLVRWLAEKQLESTVGRPEQFGLAPPDHAFLSTHPAVSQELYGRIGSGDPDDWRIKMFEGFGSQDCRKFTPKAACQIGLMEQNDLPCLPHRLQDSILVERDQSPEIHDFHVD